MRYEKARREHAHVHTHTGRKDSRHAPSRRGHTADVSCLRKAPPWICTGTVIAPGFHPPTGNCKSGPKLKREIYTKAWL